MFGYIKPFKPEMKIFEFEEYKSIYCTLCKSIGKNFGLIGRLALSYDCTFCALLRLSLKKESPQFVAKRCVVNKLKRCNYIDYDIDSFKFTGAMCVILTYYKINDDIRDSNFLKKIFYIFIKLLFHFSYKRAKKEFKDIDNIVNDMANNQIITEKNNDLGIDKSAHPTAEMLSKLFVLLSDDSETQKSLKKFGYFLGRWVYFIDASDDIEEDLKENKFNPFTKGRINKNMSENENLSLNEYCNQVLNHSLSEAILYYDLLPIYHFKNILDNIIKLGLPDIQKQVLFNKKARTNNDRSL